MKNREAISNFITLSDHDVKLIADLVDHFPTEDLIPNLKRLFREDITGQHFIVLGLLVGQRNAAKKSRAQIFNNFTLCQREN